MSLDWLPRDNEKKDHALWDDSHWGTEPPCTMYEKKPVIDAEGRELDDAFCEEVLPKPKKE